MGTGIIWRMVVSLMFCVTDEFFVHFFCFLLQKYVTVQAA
jgi:hypothetical protein